MVVKASTKKWLIDNGLDQHTAHLWADGIIISELIRLNFDETMGHLYGSYYNQLMFSINQGEIIDEETFFRDGPNKDIGFYPQGWTFRDFVTDPDDIRYDDFIYRYIQKVKREYANRKKLPSLGGDAVVIWGERDKPQIPFMNYDTLPFNEKS